MFYIGHHLVYINEEVVLPSEAVKPTTKPVRVPVPHGKTPKKAR